VSSASRVTFVRVIWVIAFARVISFIRFVRVISDQGY
jgi:hypothetical protein